MRTLFRRIIGILLVTAAIGGLVFSIVGIVGVWRYKAAAVESLTTTVQILGDTLDTTVAGLEVTQESLQGAVSSLGALQGTLQTTAKTVESTEPVMGEISRMMEEDLPEAITAAQTSLQAAQSSAAVIDGVLMTISGIPLIGSSINYNPEVTLAEALGQVSGSLDGLPDSFAAMEDGLSDTSHNLQVLQVDFALMVDAVKQIEIAVAQYEAVVGGYQGSVAQVQAQLDLLAKNIPTIVNILSWGLTIFLVWMAIAQIGLFTQGMERLASRPAA
ncbi:MAG: hypothetical protein JXA78_10065 [Anaerolineales bacterium]|nr:hypothetical protein [Anaerolineales bacterium]